MSSKAVKSPCINVCRLKDNVCIGCGRTIEQVSLWSTYTDEEKLKIIMGIKNENNHN